MKKISVIIPCYNVENYIDVCISNLSRQSVGMDAMEIILVDDCSKDGSLSKLRAIEQKYPESVMLIPLEQNVRQGAARNIALQYASAEYVAFLDADDALHPKAFEKLLRTAHAEDADVVRFLSTNTHSIGEINMETRSGKKDLNVSIDTHEVRRMFIMSDAVTPGCWDKLYRRSVITEHDLKFAEGVLLEEPLFTFPLYFYIKKFSMLNEYLYNYYQNPQGTCRNLFYDKEHQYDNLKVQYAMLLDLKKRGFLDEYHNEIGIKFVDCYYFQSIINMFAIDREIDMDVLNDMRDTVLEFFPDIKSNPYLKSFPNVRDNLQFLEVRLDRDNFEEMKIQWKRTSGISG